MLIERFLRNKRGVSLEGSEVALLQQAVAAVRHSEPRQTIISQGEEVSFCTLLVDGLMCRYIDDPSGVRQMVAVHVPGDFVDLHSFPMKELDHSIASITQTTYAVVPHQSLRQVVEGREELMRKLWFSTLIDASIHRAWLFRMGRLGALGRIAHFLCEMNARLESVGLSDGRRFVLGLTQADLAEICGMTSVHVNRVLRQLRERNVCTFRSSIVTIESPEKMVDIGSFDPYYLYINPGFGHKMA